MWERSTTLHLKFAAALFALLAAASPSRGEELTIWTHPLGAFVRLEGPTRLQGITPLPLDSRMNGEYAVRSRLTGYEEARGRVTLRSRDGSLALSSYKGNLRFERLFASLVLPGYGQISGGRIQPGLTWMTSCLGFGAGALALDGKYQDAHDEYVAADNAVEGASQSAATGDEELAARIGEVNERWVVSNHERRARDVVAVATAALWAGNLVDACFFHGGLDLREGSDGVIQMRLTEKSRLRRTVRSVLFPGLGQVYTGNSMRGALYAAGTVVAGLYAIDGHLDYKREIDRVDATIREREMLERNGLLTPERSVTVAASQRAAGNRGSDDKDRRNVWAAVTAGVWAVSVLDAAFLGPREAAAGEGAGRLTLAPQMSAGSPGIALRVGF